MKELKKYIAKQIVIYGLIVLFLWLLLEGATRLVAQKCGVEFSNFGILNENYVENVENNNSSKFYLKPKDSRMLIFLGIQLVLQITFSVLLIILCLNKIGVKIEEENNRLLQEKNELFAYIAHDLKTPITTLTGYSGMLLNGMVTTKEKEEEYLKAIYKKALRMNQLVESLFAYTKIDSKGYELVMQEIDIAELLRKNVALLYSEFEDANLKLELGITSDMVICKADSLELSRAITNLLNNELKHNNEGTTITIKLNTTEGIQIIIADDGNEIPLELVKTLFEPFVSGDESRSSKGGTGLGLAITKKIIERHNGEIRLVTDLDWCTKAFVIQL